MNTNYPSKISGKKNFQDWLYFWLPNKDTDNARRFIAHLIVQEKKIDKKKKKKKKKKK